MKLIKKTLHVLFLCILLSSTACNDKYPDLGDGMYAEIVTNHGVMVAKLHFDKTPLTVANFVALAEGNHPQVKEEYKGKKYYNGLTFHRVIKKFMIQGGDPLATGSGGPGYKFDDEFHADLKHDKPGILSMANSGPKTNGSQFFITSVPTPHLDNKHSIFGELVVGMNVQEVISNLKTEARNKPAEDVVINELNIIRKGKEALAFQAPKIFEQELEKKKKLAEEKLKSIKAKSDLSKKVFLTQNKDILKGNLKTFPSGIIMINTKKGKGIKPKNTDRVLINYAGYFVNGNLFDTNIKAVDVKHGKNTENKKYGPFPMIYNEKATLVPGFREAMLNMKVGDKARVFIPSHLAYGQPGRGSIPPNSDLVFDIEIAGVLNQK